MINIGCYHRWRWLWGTVLLLGASQTWAEESALIPSAYVGYRNLAYSAGTTDLSGLLSSLGGGLTFTQGRYYFKAAAEQDVHSEMRTAGIDFSREDAVLSAGYGVSDAISVFAGYKYGRTIITALITPVDQRVVKLTGQGPFIGAGGGWPVRDWGVLSFSAAYAELQAFYSDAQISQAQGSARGTSLSLAWQNTFNTGWGYEIALTRHDYYHQNFDNIGFSVNENLLSLSASVSYRF